MDQSEYEQARWEIVSDARDRLAHHLSWMRDASTVAEYKMDDDEWLTLERLERTAREIQDSVSITFGKFAAEFMPEMHARLAALDKEMGDTGSK